MKKSIIILVTITTLIFIMQVVGYIREARWWSLAMHVIWYGCLVGLYWAATKSKQN